jgi:molybdate transport system ATP-binding protein
VPHGARGEVFVAVRPSTVAVAAGPADGNGTGTSWRARITGLTQLADRIRLDLDGQPPAQVDVTPAQVAELSLRPGSEVWLTVAATDLEIYPAAAPG